MQRVTTTAIADPVLRGIRPREWNRGAPHPFRHAARRHFARILRDFGLDRLRFGWLYSRAVDRVPGGDDTRSAASRVAVRSCNARWQGVFLLRGSRGLMRAMPKAACEGRTARTIRPCAGAAA
ncbi:MAG: hypothetical protein ACWA6X_00385 [Bauldia sp.]